MFFPPTGERYEALYASDVTGLYAGYAQAMRHRKNGFAVRVLPRQTNNRNDNKKKLIIITIIIMIVIIIAIV